MPETNTLEPANSAGASTCKILWPAPNIETSTSIAGAAATHFVASATITEETAANIEASTSYIRVWECSKNCHFKKQILEKRKSEELIPILRLF